MKPCPYDPVVGCSVAGHWWFRRWLGCRTCYVKKDALKNIRERLNRLRKDVDVIKEELEARSGRG